MTTGTRDTRTFESTPMPGLPGGQTNRGGIVSWSGADSAVTRRPKRPWTLRTIRYQKTILKKGVPKSIVKVRTFRVYGIAPPKVDYRSPHAFTKTWDYSYLSPTLGNYYAGGQFWQNTTMLLPNVNPVDTWGSADEYKLLEKLAAQTEGGWNITNFLGAEGKDTVKFILDSANRIYRALVAVRRGKLDRAIEQLTHAGDGFRRAKGAKPSADAISYQLEVYRNALKELAHSGHRQAPGGAKGWRQLTADNWLEFHLAAAPLMGDVKAAAEQLAYTFNRPQKLVYAVSRRKGYSALSAQQSGTSHEWHVNVLQRDVRIKAFLTELPSIAQLSGIMDPEIVVWNAIPLSFVVDWFYPIGNWLESRATSSHLTGTFVRSDKYSYVIKDYLGEWYNPGHFYSMTCTTGGDQERRYGQFTRSISTTLAVPPPTFEPLGAFTSWARAATAVALISGFAGKRGF